MSRSFTVPFMLSSVLFVIRMGAGAGAAFPLSSASGGIQFSWYNSVDKGDHHFYQLLRGVGLHDGWGLVSLAGSLRMWHFSVEVQGAHCLPYIDVDRTWVFVTGKGRPISK